MSDDFLIFRKAYDFALWIYPTIDRIPKAHRPVLGAEVERGVLSC